MSKNKKTLESFVKFCEQNPDLRFWQALREFVKVEAIWLEVYDKKIDDSELKDTFYFKGRNK